MLPLSHQPAVTDTNYSQEREKAKKRDRPHITTASELQVLQVVLTRDRSLL